MSKQPRTVVDLFDDLDGSPAVATIKLGLDVGDGETVAYLEVSEQNRDLIVTTLTPWLAAGRETPEPVGLDVATASDSSDGDAANVVVDGAHGSRNGRAPNNGVKTTVTTRMSGPAAKAAKKGPAKAGSKTNSKKVNSKTNGAVDNDTIRKWLRANGHTVSDRGLISAKNRELFDAAHSS